MSEDNGFTVEILHMGWLNMYAPFFLNVMRYGLYDPEEGGSIELVSSSEDTEEEVKDDIKKVRLFQKAAKELFGSKNGLQTLFHKQNSEEIQLKEIRFKKCKSDTEIIEKLIREHTEHTAKKIFRIGLCEPMFLREKKTDSEEETISISEEEKKKLKEEKDKREGQKNQLYYEVFINRLLLWGLTDVSLLESNGLLLKKKDADLFETVETLFKGNANKLLEMIKEKIKEKIKYGFSKLNETENKLLDVYVYPKGTTIYEEVENIFRGIKEHVKFIEKDLSGVYKPLKPDKRAEESNKPWIIFTAEPTRGFKEFGGLDEDGVNRLKNIKFVSPPTSGIIPFTGMICNKDQLKDNAFTEFFESFKKNLQETTKIFYQENLDGPFAQSVAKGDNERLDLLEWEIYRNQRIYHFDIKQETEKWRTVFYGIATEIQEQAKQDNQSEIFSDKEYEPKDLRDDEKNFIDTIAIGQESKISDDKDLKETAFFMLGVLSRLHKAQQLASKKSAIAAIISRNMSHNLGSHVINYLKHFVDILGKSLSLGWIPECNEYTFDIGALEKYVEQGDLDKTFKEEKIVWDGGDLGEISFLDESLYRFLEYLNRRMEFIATMTTSVPSTPLVMNFDAEILKPMVHKNSFLVDFIAKSDLDEKMELSLNWRLSNSSKDRKNLEIAVPDGVVGCHALYTIIENFVRNSAKHGSQGSEEDKLEIRIDISEYDNDYFEVKISDNLKNGKDLIKILKNLQAQKDPQEQAKNQKPFIQFEKRNDNDFYVLNPRLIDETGNLIHHLWGIKEMFIGACFLRGLTPQEYNLKHDKLPVLSTGTDKDENLVYNFYITKPKFLLILSKKDCNDFRNLEGNQFKDNGVDFLDYETFEQGKYFIRHRFCLLHFCPSKDLGQCVVNNGKSKCADDYNNWIAKNENLLPYRIFCDCQYSPTDRNWVSWKSEWTNITNFNELQNNLYPKWIKHFYELDAIPSLIIIDSKTNKEHWKDEAVFLESNELKSYFCDNKPESAVIFYSHLMKDQQEKQSLKKTIDKNCSRVIWEEISGGNATNHLIREVTGSSDVGLRKYELIEACLASVVIIDERIYNNCEANLYDFNWNWRDIRVYNFVIKKDEENEDEKKKWFISKHSGKIEWKDLNDGYSFLKFEKDKKTDFLVIHRGIIEKILKTEREERVDELFENLMNVARFIIVDSGRGKPDYILKSRYVRFTNLENLYQWFFDCKVSLVRGLFSLINREEV